MLLKGYFTLYVGSLFILLHQKNPITFTNFIQSDLHSRYTFWLLCMPWESNFGFASTMLHCLSYKNVFIFLLTSPKSTCMGKKILFSKTIFHMHTFMKRKHIIQDGWESAEASAVMLFMYCSGTMAHMLSNSQTV